MVIRNRIDARRNYLQKGYKVHSNWSPTGTQYWLKKEIEKSEFGIRQYDSVRLHKYLALELLNE